MPGVGDGLVQQAERLAGIGDRGRVAALVAGVEGALAVALEQDLGEREVDLGRDLHRLEDRVGADRDDDELLEVEIVGGVLAAVDQVDQRHREHVRVRVERPVERDPGSLGPRPCSRQRDAQESVGAEARLVGSAVELDQRVVEAALLGQRRADEGVADLAGDVANRVQDAEAAEAVAAVAQLAGLVRSGRAAGGDVGGSDHTALELEVDLHGRQTAAVEDLSGPNIGDGGFAHRVTSLASRPSPAARALLRFWTASVRWRRKSSSARAASPSTIAASSSVCSSATCEGRS